MIITLITDFGDSEYVGAMKGVIYSICPDATIVDITHSIKKFDIRQASYAVFSACKYFPRGTIHCVVVDPGVGTGRRSVIIETDKYSFIGPDNGVFTFVTGIKKVYEISYPGSSKTFHGRDIFAPIAARLASGSEAREFGSQMKGLKRIGLTEVKVENGVTTGEVICSDSFGNVITNIKGVGFKYGAELQFKVEEKSYKSRLLESYGFADVGELVCIINSEGYLEFAVNQGNASKILHANGGEKVEVMEA